MQPPGLERHISVKPVIKRIYSENDLFQHLEVLKRNRNKRISDHEFFVEGVLSLEYAVKYGWRIKILAYAHEKPLSNWAKDLINEAHAEMLLEMPLPLLTKLSDKDEDISELVAVIEMRDYDISSLADKRNLLLVIFDRPSSHGNLGTLIRSCEAFGVDAMVMTGHAVDLYDPKTIRSSMGAFFITPCLRLPSHQELIPYFDRVRSSYPDFKVIGSSSKGENLLEDEDMTGPTALLIGNETYGLNKNYKALSDKIVRIPMHGESTSFNVSCAASIMLYEADRQRRAIFKQHPHHS